MYTENYIQSLRMEMVAMVQKHLSPAALAYAYSDVPLESTIKWRPMVLFLGNYSSGKSTLINEFLGADIQAIGQAPTDDCFTVITYDESGKDSDTITVTEERDGKFLLNDPDYPFEILKKHGQRFASHFRLKKVNSPFLKTLALIDTPGMLDSITERDRGYNYQDVIGDLAQLADLVLVLFDPHKAGTVREAHTSLRETIATRTFEDRVLFVLNRIDECNSLSDLLQVYGTLCWNLSQITGRKDIPPIHLTYSSRAADKEIRVSTEDRRFLYYLENQRKKLKHAVLEAPRRRLDNLATFVETHSERLDHLLEALVNFQKQFRNVRIKYSLIGFLISALAGISSVWGAAQGGIFGGLTDPLALTTCAAFTAMAFCFWIFAPLQYIKSRFLRKTLNNIDEITLLNTQTRRDSWQAVRDMVSDYIHRTQGKFSLRDVRRHYDEVHRVFVDGTREIRKALNELSGMKNDQTAPEFSEYPNMTTSSHETFEHDSDQNRI